jgi:2-hydroxy-6-oxonona-2,4-dienedioate hydrolase
MKTPRLFLSILGLLTAFSLHAELKLPADTIPPQRSVSVYGTKIVYYDLGSGPTLVLLHGAAASATLDWAQVIKPLAARYRVIALDQIGFGLSDKPTIDYTVDTWVDFLGEFLRQMGISHTMLAGESLGGWIAAKYAIAASHTDSNLPRVDKLILSDAAGHASLFQAVANVNSRSPFVFSRGPSTFAEYRQGFLGIFYNKQAPGDEFLRQMYALKLSWHDGETMASLMAGFSGDPKRLISQSVDGHLSEIKVPTLVVWGANDSLIPLSDGQDFAANVAGARLLVIPECGHVPPVEKADEFLKVSFAFLGDGPEH